MTTPEALAGPITNGELRRVIGTALKIARKLRPHDQDSREFSDAFEKLDPAIAGLYEHIATLTAQLAAALTVTDEMVDRAILAHYPNFDRYSTAQQFLFIDNMRHALTCAFDETISTRLDAPPIKRSNTCAYVFEINIEGACVGARASCIPDELEPFDVKVEPFCPFCGRRITMDLSPTPGSDR